MGRIVMVAIVVTMAVAGSPGSTFEQPQASAASRPLFQACLYAGSLSQVRSYDPDSSVAISCGRGEKIILVGGDGLSPGQYHACLYAGSLSQVGLSAPAACGRGRHITLATGTDLFACLYAGALSRIGASIPASCGRGAASVALAIFTGEFPPDADDIQATATPSVPLEITLSAQDPDSDSLSFEIVSGPLHGMLDTTTPSATCAPVADGVACTATVTYTGAFGVTGSDSFSYRASDGNLESSLATVSLTLDYPAAHVQIVTASEGGTVEIPGQISLEIIPDGLNCDAIVTITVGPPSMDHTDDPASNSFDIELEPVDPPNCLGGIEIYPDITITISYDPSAIPLGKTPNDLYVARFDTPTWESVTLGEVTDEINATISVQTLDFSRWNVFIE